MIRTWAQTFLTELGTNILPYVRELAEAALPVVQEGLGKIGDYMTGTIIPAAETAVKWVSENKDLILALAAGILTAVGAYKAYKLAVTAYNAVMGIYEVVTAASATGTFTLAGAMTALNLPVLAVVAAIGAAVAIGVLLYKNWDTVKVKAAGAGRKNSTGVRKYSELGHNHNFKSGGRVSDKLSHAVRLYHRMVEKHTGSR